MTSRECFERGRNGSLFLDEKIVKEKKREKIEKLKRKVERERGVARGWGGVFIRRINVGIIYVGNCKFVIFAVTGIFYDILFLDFLRLYSRVLSLVSGWGVVI